MIKSFCDNCDVEINDGEYGVLTIQRFDHPGIIREFIYCPECSDGIQINSLGKPKHIQEVD